MPDPDVVFVGGLHRSGTTLLARILEDHPDVSGLVDTGVPMDEGQHLQDVYPTARDLGGAGHFGLRERGHLTEEDAEPSMRERLWAAWSPYWDLEADVVVEKSPPNLIRTRFLQTLFPGARFVILVRHPVATCLATQRWSIFNALSFLVKHWVHCHELFAGDRRHLDRVHVLKYEDLVDEPEGELDRLWGFLDLDPAPLQREIRPDVNARYLSLWEKRRRWPIYGAYLRWIEGRFEEDARRWGYSLRERKDLGGMPILAGS